MLKVAQLLGQLGGFLTLGSVLFTISPRSATNALRAAASVPAPGARCGEMKEEAVDNITRCAGVCSCVRAVAVTDRSARSLDVRLRFLRFSWSG
jgi:hypothetical protein